MKKLFVLMSIFIATMTVVAQNGVFESDIARLLRLNGSSASFDVAFDQITSQFQMMKPSIPDSVWASLRKEVFDPEVEILFRKMVPVYKKYFTHEEVKGLIAFFESPLGKDYMENSARVTKEMLPVSQTWGMGLGQKINDYLTQKGF
jgi:hypothetical protein